MGPGVVETNVNHSEDFTQFKEASLRRQTFSPRFAHLHAGSRSAKLLALAGAPVSPGAESEDGAFSGAKRWFNQIPAFLTHHGMRQPSDTSDSLVRARPEKRKGDVTCLQYGTIDDAGMRRLEGRS